MKKCCIVVPTYNVDMSPDEIQSLRRLKDVLGEYDTYLVAPEGMNDAKYRVIYGEGLKTEFFSVDYFTSRMSYCLMCCKPEFYERFSEYEYMLIYQLDCWVFNNELEYWCTRDFDYIGAPFFIPGYMEEGKLVGNGGFSLRKIKSMIAYTTKYSDETLPEYGTDDGYFTTNFDDTLKIPNCMVASLFSLETRAPELVMQTKTLPFGCHAYKRYSWWFWENFIKYNENNIEKDTDK